MRLVILVFLSLSAAFAADAKKYTLREFSPTNYISGPRLTPALQKDKATLIIFWGYVVGGSRSGASLKMFQQIAEKHKDDLVVIGVETLNQAGSAKLIPLLLKSDGITFSNYNGCRTPYKIKETPHLCLFNRDGKMTYSGEVNVGEIDDEVIKALAAPEEKKTK
jgi:hypothetical protein